MQKLSLFLAAYAATLAAQTIYIPVDAPFAQDLVVATKTAHPELQKLGLHAVPPGQHDYAIVANGITSKIGKKSSAADLAVLQTGKATVKRDEAGQFFDLCLPISDSAGHPIGMTVMEIPFAFATGADDALAKATAIRDHLQANIASQAQLFEETDAPLKPVDTIAVPAGVKGRFDHFGVDLKHNRLFSTPEDYHAVVVLDLVSGQPVAEIPAIAKPHAVLYREDLNRIFVTDGEDGAVKIFDGKTYRPLGAIPLAKDADSIGYDASSRRLYVVNGGKDAGQPYSMV